MINTFALIISFFLFWNINGYTIVTDSTYENITEVMINPEYISENVTTESSESTDTETEIYDTISTNDTEITNDTTTTATTTTTTIINELSTEPVDTTDSITDATEESSTTLISTDSMTTTTLKPTTPRNIWKILTPKPFKEPIEQSKNNYEYKNKNLGDSSIKTKSRSRNSSRRPPSLAERSNTRWKKRDSNLDYRSFHPVCTMKKDSGYGKERFSYWFYNDESRQCEWFHYTGEGGNGNRFKYRANCEESCVERSGDMCLRNELVYCKESWLQCKMVEDKKCYEKYKDNEEKIITDCPPAQPMCLIHPRLQLASDFRTPPLYLTHRSIVPPECKLKKDPGSCDMNEARELKYYYDSNQDECSMFLYSGCDGNSNRFDTKKKCMDHCAY